MIPDAIWALLLGYLADLAFGDPEWFAHPVRLIGKYIAFAEKKIRARGKNLRRWAVFLTLSTVFLTMAVTALILWCLSLWGRRPLFFGMVFFNWAGLSARCLASEAEGVRRALSRGVHDARRQVSRIVGRDTQSLCAEEIMAATIETVAENTTDGVISPMLFSALFGPVGMMGFKAASTLDSMVGYLDEKYRDIGWASAKFDDVLNFIPARLTAVLLCASAWLLRLDAKGALRTVLRDHKNHKSPNCAWSEAAAAGALGIQLGGTHDYFGKPVVKPTIGDRRRAIEEKDIERVSRMMFLASAIFILCIFAAHWFF